MVKVLRHRYHLMWGKITWCEQHKKVKTSEEKSLLVKFFLRIQSIMTEKGKTRVFSILWILWNLSFESFETCLLNSLNPLKPVVWIRPTQASQCAGQPPRLVLHARSEQFKVQTNSKQFKPKPIENYWQQFKPIENSLNQLKTIENNSNQLKSIEWVEMSETKPNFHFSVFVPETNTCLSSVWRCQLRRRTASTLKAMQSIYVLNLYSKEQPTANADKNHMQQKDTVGMKMHPPLNWCSCI